MPARKPRVKRPNLRHLGYDSIWEAVLHESILKDWEHHTDYVSYVIEHKYEPDFVKWFGKKKILIEAKGRFWDHAEYNKYVWIRKTLAPNTELVFIFADPNLPMPFAQKRKDGSKRSHGEWASKNNFKWYTSDTLPEEWRSDEQLEEQLA